MSEKVLDKGGTLDDFKAFQNSMLFILNPLEGAEEQKEDPMWSSASSRELDWYLTDE
ncbi:MAG: hypothetical protein ABR903_04715 [Thermodesulfovibrionales bacterium]